MYDVHKMITYSTDHVCPSVYVIQLYHRQMHLDEILYECYGIESHSELIHFNFHLVITACTSVCVMGDTLMLFSIGSLSGV